MTATASRLPMPVQSPTEFPTPNGHTTPALVQSPALLSYSSIPSYARATQSSLPASATSPDLSAAASSSSSSSPSGLPRSSSGIPRPQSAAGQNNNSPYSRPTPRASNGGSANGGPAHKKTASVIPGLPVGATDIKVSARAAKQAKQREAEEAEKARVAEVEREKKAKKKAATKKKAAAKAGPGPHGTQLPTPVKQQLRTALPPAASKLSAAAPEFSFSPTHLHATAPAFVPPPAAPAAVQEVVAERHTDNEPAAATEEEHSTAPSIPEQDTPAAPTETAVQSEFAEEAHAATPNEKADEGATEEEHEPEQAVDEQVEALVEQLMAEPAAEIPAPAVEEAHVEEEASELTPQVVEETTAIAPADAEQLVVEANEVDASPATPEDALVETMTAQPAALDQTVISAPAAAEAVEEIKTEEIPAEDDVIECATELLPEPVQAMVDAIVDVVTGETSVAEVIAPAEEQGDEEELTKEFAVPEAEYEVPTPEVLEVAEKAEEVAQVSEEVGVETEETTTPASEAATVVPEPVKVGDFAPRESAFDLQAEPAVGEPKSVEVGGETAEVTPLDKGEEEDDSRSDGGSDKSGPMANEVAKETEAPSLTMAIMSAWGTANWATRIPAVLASMAINFGLPFINGVMLGTRRKPCSPLPMLWPFLC